MALGRNEVQAIFCFDPFEDEQKAPLSRLAARLSVRHRSRHDPPTGMGASSQLRHECSTELKQYACCAAVQSEAKGPLLHLLNPVSLKLPRDYCLLLSLWYYL